jgi:hypothetical protein
MRRGVHWLGSLVLAAFAVATPNLPRASRYPKTHAPDFHHLSSASLRPWKQNPGEDAVLQVSSIGLSALPWGGHPPVPLPDCHTSD